MDYKKIEYLYWQFFNTLIKFVGVLSIIAGALISVSFMLNILKTDLYIRLFGSIIPLLGILFGLLLIKAKNFYPQHIKAWKDRDIKDSERKI